MAGCDESNSKKRLRYFENRRGSWRNFRFDCKEQGDFRLKEKTARGSKKV